MNEMAKMLEKGGSFRRGQNPVVLRWRKKGEISDRKDLRIGSVHQPGQGSRVPSPAGGISGDRGKGKSFRSLRVINLAKSSLVGRTGARITDRDWVQAV